MTASQKQSRLIATLLTIAIASAVTACTPSGDTDSPSIPDSGAATSSSSTTPSATPSASSPTPSATPTPTETCDTVLTAAEYASLAEDNLVLRDRAEPFDDVMIEMMDEGALGCQWAGQGDVRVWFAQLPLDEAAWEIRRAELVAQGYSQSDDPFAGTLLGPEDADPNFIPSVYYTDGTLYYVSYSTFLRSVLALQ